MTKRKGAVLADAPIPYAVPSPPDCNIGMCEKSAEPRRNRVADLIRAEALYLQLESLYDFLPRAAYTGEHGAFMNVVAAEITKLRLSR